MNLQQFNDIAAPGVVIGMFAGGIAVLLLVTMLIAIIETVVLTLVGWGDFRTSLKVSILMNVVSGIVGAILLVIFPQPTIEGLAIAMLISILIEGVIMIRNKAENVRLTVFAVILANIISYAIVIFPAFAYSQS